MNLMDYFSAIRRRWVVVVAAVMVALVAGFAITSTVKPKPARPSAYTARTLLLNLSASIPNGAPTSALGAFIAASLTETGEIPRRVDEALNYEGTPIQLARKIDATVERDTGLLNITATADTPGEAEKIADTFATELLDYLENLSVETRNAILDPMVREIKELEETVADLDEQILGATGPRLSELSEQRDEAAQRMNSLEQQVEQLANTAGTNGSGYFIIQEAIAQPIEDQGLKAPGSSFSRLLIAGILGLLAGLALALVVERYDPRIQTRQEAEEHFGLPVIAQVPALPMRRRGSLSPAVFGRDSQFADAFRLLSAAVVTGPSRLLGDGWNKSSAATGRTIKTVLVTSPSMSEGKSTVVANLAAAFGELGKSVIILSCDLHRPRLHEMFDVENHDGLSEALASRENGPILDGYVTDTHVQNVRLVVSGSEADRPTQLLSSARMKAAIKEASRRADIVLLDSPPIFVAGEAGMLASEVDAVLVVAYSGKTKIEPAVRSTEYLQRLAAPAVGVVLNGERDSALPQSYYKEAEPTILSRLQSSMRRGA
jgi:capsular exopolysaccharide synthesis family protein